MKGKNTFSIKILSFWQDKLALEQEIVTLILKYLISK
jgi:hypothetical protein